MAFRSLAHDPVLGAELIRLSGMQGASILVLSKAEDVMLDGMLHEERTTTGSNDNQIVLSIFRRRQALTDMTDRTRMCIYHIHGGGMTMGNRFMTVQWALQAVERFDAVCVSVEYRLAPAHPDPAPVEDCYAGLLWVAHHAQELGFSVSRILLNGVSAGGGLAAGVALLARDRDGPRLLGQTLFAPMLDDRCDTLSAHQLEGVGLWDRQADIQGWTALLGKRRGTADVSIYAAPARATDVSGLPPTYVDVGAVETFRSEVVEYAQKLWRDGVACELHVWPGAFHGFEYFCPAAKVTLAAVSAKMDWVERLLAASHPSVVGQ